MILDATLEKNKIKSIGVCGAREIIPTLAVNLHYLTFKRNKHTMDVDNGPESRLSFYH
ncbi:hypothetical protein WN48_09811 [Eufriesea mexicana]|uniref:Uncharacterized protein n=1 Tax=Eufriesea mexicana TaxID=516756 RepID=A0A310SH48_9HYME|nr:hypothetical protein WN48_09811 [Eufriesea mexicana]